ncbi:RcnB family protein [Paracoccus luteus]|uniref:RcnB family protein n=1 Tax=Paracoccus luteus TaxID=2508543 RepID=UPI001431F15F|nr:RcnB family protein [Paracoccus luteus]
MIRSALLAGLMAATLPLSALADKPAHAGGNNSGNGNKGQSQHSAKARDHAPQLRRAPVVVIRDTDRRRDPVVVVDPDRPARTLVQRACPPGLAKKSPACVPPGQARKMDGRVVVGDRIDWNHVHVVTRPGLYGLTEPPRGQRYAIVDGRLVRVDSGTARILSIIRLVEALLD